MAFDHHLPVLCDQVIDAFAPRAEAKLVDATFGRGGHSRALLNRLGPEGRVLAIDQDPQAVEVGKALAQSDARLSIVHANFEALDQVVQQAGWLGQVDGILMDLGVSSPQLDNAQRGFSFMRDGPLDMRMDTTHGMSAATWLADVSEAELADVLWQLGEERYARAIAQAIVKARELAPIETTGQLAKIIDQSVWKKDPHKHPATRSFQAIRLHINREMDVLHTALAHSLEALKVGGRLAVISFHSLEDRIVKRFIQTYSAGNEDVYILHQPPKQPRLKRVGQAMRPDAQAVEDNIRARSATLRVAQKLA